MYLHGNCSSRLEALPIVDLMTVRGISVFCFDFAGCGLSEGEYVSLGWHERDDLELVIEYLRKLGFKQIGLWGRSMGAVTALMYSERDLSLTALVLDSPFSDLKTLVKDLAHSHVPSFLLKPALKLISSSIKKRAHFDLSAVNPYAHVDHCFVPALFGVALNDLLVSPAHHGELLFHKYAGEKVLIKFSGGHNDNRPEAFMEQAAEFLREKIGQEKLTEI